MNSQMSSTVRKIHNLLSSGAVTVTGPNQSRIVKHKVGGGGTTAGGGATATNNHQAAILQPGGGATTTLVGVSGSAQTNARCYICDDLHSPASQQHNPITELQTSHTSTKFPNKIGQLVGEGYIVIVSAEDVVCSRCTNLVNYLDRLETDVERMRTNLVNLLNRKYGLYDEGTNSGSAGSPPVKMQKLNSGAGTRVTEEATDGGTRIRKTLVTVENPGGNKQAPPVSSVQQMKIATQGNSSGQMTVHRKTARIYKCSCCDYKTSDMRLFNTHFETCKQQNFQCKNCKRVFPNFGSMKTHMMREHNTSMEFTCAVCHINFINDSALRRHMESNHSTNVLVTSTTTLPSTSGITVGVSAADVALMQQTGKQQAGSPATGSANSAGQPGTLPMYTCNNCQFKSTDKVLLEEHMRKHLHTNKPKPFKCRLCSQRFETREAATVHAKQHQPTYFKCGTCAMSFSNRDLLVKHFEVHQQEQQQQQQEQQQKASQQHHGPSVTTQKLLQETIDEALSDSVSTTTTLAVANTSDATGASGAASAADGIHFFSCHLCSLTFLQENYYNQHMETHRTDKKSSGGEAGATIVAGVADVAGVGVGGTPLGGGNGTAIGSAASAMITTEGLAKADDVHAMASRQSSTNVATTNISEADIESLFEKMHSDKGDTAAVVVTTGAGGATTTTKTTAVGSSNGATGQSDNLVITSQEATGGGITFNITIPQSADPAQAGAAGAAGKVKSSPVSVSIDMPVLDEGTGSVAAGKANAADGKATDGGQDDGDNKSVSASGPVSMPSLDDDGEAQQTPTSKDLDAGASKAGKANASESAKNASKNAGDSKEAAESEEAAEGEGLNHHEATQHEEGDAEAAEQADGHAKGDGSVHEHQQQQQQQVAMELDESMQAPVEGGGQIKFVLNENGELLQLDNHIITDADGNQILVQDPEQIQQLLQSVGMDGEATIQMVTDDNGHMILVQGGEGNAQVIDESLLNADGQLVIQQGHDGELGEGAHVIGEDGTRIPVSVSYTADGQPIVQVQRQVIEATSSKDGRSRADAAGEQHVNSAEPAGSVSGDSGTGSVAQTGDAEGTFLPLEYLMNSPDVKAE